jgi:hypothetical protein
VRFILRHGVCMGFFVVCFSAILGLRHAVDGQMKKTDLGLVRFEGV